MIKKILLFILIALLPIPSEAAYKVYLKNGSVIKGVISHVKKGDEVTIYFSSGSMLIPEKDILKIEETKSVESYVSPEKTVEPEEKQEKPEDTSALPQVPAVDKSARIDELKANIETLNSEIKTTEDQETRLVATINEKTGKRFGYNIYQLTQIEREVEPLRQELFAIQQKKGELIQKKAALEGEIRALLE